MKYVSWPLGIVLVTIFSGCHPLDDPNAVTFKAAAKGVNSVKNVTVSGSDALEKEIVSLGGYPPAADLVTNKKATDIQYSIGYDGNKKPLVAISLAKNGAVTVITDPDLLVGYTAKVRTLTGEKASSSSSGDSASPGSGDSPAASFSGGGNTPKGCPIHIGDSKAVVKKKLGSPRMVEQEGTDHEIWFCHPLQGADVADDIAFRAVSSVSGLFSGTANQEEAKAIKKKDFIVYFSGSSVARVTMSSSN